MNRFCKIFIFIFIFSLLFLIQETKATRLYFDSIENGVEVRLDTENENINAVDINLDFSSGLELKDFSDGGSIISLWAERPELGSKQSSFSGLVPGGFRGDGLLLKLILESKEIGDRKISFKEDSNVLLNDGRGTPASLRFTNYYESQIIEEVDVPVDSAPQDTNLPEAFEPRLVQMNDVFDGRYFVVFSAQDKDSGVDYYEVFDDGEWVKAESPYVLKNQNLEDLRKNLQVRAIDKAGNERIEKVSLEKESTWYKKYFIWGIIAVMGLVVFVVWKISKKKSALV